MKHKLILVLLFLGISLFTQAQFDPAAGKPGSKAIYKDSSIIKSWATDCQVTRGWMQCSDQSLGLATAGTENAAIGKAGENGVISLGDGGMAILTFSKPIQNIDGPDFAIFENSFADDFLELAFVEVSSDGSRYIRFPSISNTPTDKQIGSFSTIKATDIYNLAGKHRGLYGTPFNLDDIADSNGIDLENVRYVKIIDVVGSIDTCQSRDSKGQIINDPWPTPFPSSGFDLDAVAVLGKESSSVSDFTLYSLNFKNPVENQEVFEIGWIGLVAFLTISDIQGRVVNFQSTCFESSTSIILTTGIYIIMIEGEQGIIRKKLVVN